MTGKARQPQTPVENPQRVRQTTSWEDWGAPSGSPRESGYAKPYERLPVGRNPEATPAATGEAAPLK